jgi:hypothetical protein
MTSELLQAMAESAFSIAWAFLEDGEDPDPVWLVLKGTGQVEIVLTPWANDAEKLLSAMGIAAMVSLTEATAVVQVADMFVRGTGGPSHGRPSERPEAQEALYLRGQTSDGERISRARVYGRRDNGSVHVIREIKFDSDESIFDPVWDALAGNDG